MICNTKRKGFFQYRIQSRRAPPQGFNSWCSIWKFWTNITWSNRVYFQELGNMSCSWLTAFTTGAKQKNRMTLKNNLEKNKYSIQFPWKCGGKQKKTTCRLHIKLPRYTFQQYDLDPCHRGQLLLEGHEQHSCLYQIFDYQLW